VEKVLELALWAPSGWGKQEWSFVVVQGKARDDLQRVFSAALDEVRPILERIYPTQPEYVAELLQFFDTYGGAPILILAYAGKLPDGQDDILSTAVAMQNLFLAAHSVGLGSTWTDVMRVREREINQLVGVADDDRLVCVAPLGYPAVVPEPHKRRSGRVKWIED
jgi:nitroreductase